MNGLRMPIIGSMLVLSACAGPVMRDLDVANLDSTCRLWAGFPANVNATHGRIKRWPTERERIPVEMPAAENDRRRIERALTQIELRLRGESHTLFLRDGKPRERGHGLVVSMRTACGAESEPGYTLCGNVSRGAGECGSPLPTLNDRLYDKSGELNGLLWVNIDTQDYEARHECIVHEFGHALGFSTHFPGFGDDEGEISEHFWDVLRTLYSHPPGTAREHIRVTQQASFAERLRVSTKPSSCFK